jgi:hypothetical protein
MHVRRAGRRPEYGDHRVVGRRRAHTVLLNECRLVALAAHWADLHHPDSQAPVEKPLPGAEQGRQWAGTVLQRCWSSPVQSLVPGRIARRRGEEERGDTVFVPE